MGSRHPGKKTAATAPGRPAEVATQVPLSRGKLWAFRAAAASIPLLLVLLLELGLRIAGFGYSTELFRKVQTAPGSAWGDNPAFTRRFFSLQYAPEPRSFAFPVEKGTNTTRIFVLGESAALGEPDAKFGFASMLKVMLPERFPDRRFEIVNLSIVAINSHVIREIAREAVPLEADLWLIYMGNNEAIGPFGSLSVFGARTPPLWLARASLWVQTTRVGQFLDAVIQRVRRGRGTPEEWRGMNTFAGRALRHDAPAAERVYRNFERNLADILDSARRAKARVLLCTVGVNLRDCAPFASLHRPGISAEQASAWERAFNEGRQSMEQGKTNEALGHFEAAAAIDDSYADLLYRRAQAHAGTVEKAAPLFSQARDCDALQFRTDSRANERIRKAGSQPGVTLVDVAQQMSANGHIPGREWFYEHVHFTPEGNYLVARTLADAVAAQLQAAVPGQSALPPGDWITLPQCLERLGYTDFSRQESLNTILKIVEAPPFRKDDHRALIEPVRDELERLRPLVKGSRLRQSVPALRRAVSMRPGDPDLHRALAEILEQVGDQAGAVEEWNFVAEALPHSAVAQYRLGRALEAKGDESGARQAYTRSLACGSNFAAAHEGLGLLLARSGEAASALPHLEAAIQLNPTQVGVRLALAKAFAQLGRKPEALREVEAVLRLDAANAEGLALRRELAGR